MTKSFLVNNQTGGAQTTDFFPATMLDLLEDNQIIMIDRKVQGQVSQTMQNNSLMITLSAGFLSSDSLLLIIDAPLRKEVSIRLKVSIETRMFVC